MLPKIGLNKTGVYIGTRTNHINSQSDSVRKHQRDVALIGLLYNCLLAKSALLLRFLLGQDVVLEGTLALDLAGSGHFEALLRS